MKHNLRRVLRLTEARTFWVRAIRAWRDLLPDWTPTLDALRELETMPHEHRAAVAVVSEGWQANDPRWDVLMALLEWERRQARDDEAATGYFRELKERLEPPLCLPGECTWPDCDCKKPSAQQAIIPVTVVKGGHVVSETETTVETPLKAFFLDNVRPIKHLSEKSDARQEPPAPGDVPAPREPHHHP